MSKRRRKSPLVERVARSSDFKSVRPVEESRLPKQTERINAHDLFSHFTANIIKKKTTFTR